MNKQKRPVVKKTLIRNSSHSAMVTNEGVPTVAPSARQFTSKVPSLNSQMSRLSVDNEKCSNVASKGSGSSSQAICKPIPKTEFHTPDLQSILKLSKKIDKVVQIRQTKSASDVDKNRLALDEKITRKINFPQDKPIFRDLIPISNYEKKSQKVVPVRDPKPPIDPEPKLEDFLEHREVKNYVSIPKIDLKSYLNQLEVNNEPPSRYLRLYGLVQAHRETDIKSNVENEENSN